jgi:alkylation response protein AidB-like acyl-CoA dehydrogenase
MGPPPAIAGLEALVFSELADGRRIGQLLDTNPERFREMKAYRLSAALNTLGCPAWMKPVPFTLLDGHSLQELSVVQRCTLYEALGYVDPNLIFAAPGPSMAAFVVNGIGSDAQKHWFFKHFTHTLTWSFFALTELQAGSDAGRIATTVTVTDRGYRIRGEKYLIGNGAIASIGVVFARSAPGPLGVDAFLVKPRGLGGLTIDRLPTTGCRGANLSRLVFDEVLLRHDALLGAHLKPTARIAASAAVTFDALRPCVAAIALGIARAVLDRAEAAGMLTRTSDREALVHARLDIDALRQALQGVCAAFDAGHRQSRTAGHLKAVATNRAELIVADIIARSGPGALIEYPWLAKAWRDVKAFEYTEGTTNIHLLNAATLFRGGC